MGGRGRGNVKVYIDGDPSGLGRAVKQSETYLGRLGAGVTRAGDKMVAAGSTLNRAVTLPVLAIGAVAGKTAIDFDKSMRNVNSIAQLPEKGLHRLEKRVLSLAGPTAQAPRTLAEGLYDLVSSGFDANESMVVLGKSARAATAGLTTTEVSTAAVAAVLNSYHLKAGAAGRTSDQLFETVNRGVISFEDLATNIGDVLPFASSLEVGLSQVGASISTMTKEGISAPETMTRIKNVMVTLLKPGKALNEVLNEIGLSGEELVRKKGFQGALETIISRTDGSKEAVSALFPNIRALGGVLALTGGNARSANQDLAAFKDTAGATNKALSQQKKSLSYEWGQFRAELEETAVKAAPSFLDAAKEIVGEVGDIVEGFDQLSPSTKKLIINIALLGAAMGPVLTIGGNLMKLLGGTIRVADKAAGAFRTIGTGAAAASTTAATAGAPVGAAGAGRTFAERFPGVQATFGTYELARSFGRGRAASTVAQAGATGGAVARSLAGGLAGALGPALAAIGVGKILLSATSGDWKDAGFQAGGALVGGIAGAFLGNPMLGAGVGSLLGGMVEGLFDGGSEIPRMQERLERSATGVAEAYKKQREATRNLQQTDAQVAQSRRRQLTATERAEAAERKLGQARRRSGPNSRAAIAAEVDLARAKRQVVQAERAQQRAERLHGQELRATKELMRVAVLEERHRINVLRDSRRALAEKRRAMKQEGASLQELRPVNERLLDTTKKLRNANRMYAQTLLDAARQAGPGFAKFLRQGSQDALNFGQNTRRLSHSLKDITDPLHGTIFETKKWGEATAGATKDAKRGYEQTKGVLGPFRSETSRQLGKATGDVKSFAKGTQGGFKEVETSLGTALTNLGVKSVSFTTASAERKARGGGVARVPGRGREDTVGLMVNGALSAMIAPGEDLIVANRHQRPELDYAVANTYGDRGLDGFFQRSTRPHYMAKGGIPRPSLTGSDPMQDMGQFAINRVWKAARRYLSKVGGDKTLRALIKEGNRMDALHQPYLWGGGHGAMPSKNGPWDCSGGISQLFYGAGWKDLRPMVSSGFESFGASGSGRASIYANAEHVYAVLDGRAIGTSGENPGGGFGWINGYTSRPGFVVRHVDLAGEGAPTRRRTGRGQNLKKGMAAGGIVTGSATWFTGGETAGGSDTSRPGVALNLDTSKEPGGWDNATTQGWMEASQAGHPVYARVTIGGKSADLPITDKGPASWTGHSIDVTVGGVRKLGFTTDTFPSGSVGKAVILGEGGEKKDPDQIPVHGRHKLSFDEKVSRADTTIAKAETTASKKDDRRAVVGKLDLLRGRKKYLEKKIVGINKKLKGKLKPPVRERLLQQRESFLSELAGMPGEASSLIESLREAGVGQRQLKKYAHGFGIGVADPEGPPTARDRADLLLARAERTATKSDDVEALHLLVGIAQQELKVAKKSGDPRKIAEAARNLKDAADALRDATPTATDYANRDLALAELTESTDDDRAALEKLKSIAQEQLNAAIASGDPAAIAEAAQLLKGAADALASATPTATDFANRDLALAELTESTDDDKAALEKLKELAEQQLASALTTSDPRDDIEAAQNLKGVEDALKSLESTMTELEQQRQEYEQQRLETDKRLADLAEKQGPAFAAALLSWVEGGIGGPVQRRQKLATPGVPANFQ
jgi:TP901 family phage tail tape measure protein